MSLLPAPRTKRDQQLVEKLEAWHRVYHDPRHLGGDPLQFAHRYTKDADREVVALISAGLASGNIKAILAVLERILDVLGDSPARWLAGREAGDMQGMFAGIQHRWVRDRDIELLMALLGAALRRHGSLGNLWRACDDGDDATIYPALGRFVEDILAGDRGPLESRPRQIHRADGTVSDLATIESIILTSPEKGSACKRMVLFLRWMVRPADGIDMGLWTDHTSPSRLVMPLDVHVMRIAQSLKLTRRPQPSRRAAEEVTAAFRRLCPGDPCRWDFCLVRAGIGESASG
jgi:uncharacterized protein (TIGR02757 family)